MSSRRNGQIRFEAWVPEDLFRAFQAKASSGRKAWLVAAMRDFTFGPGGCTHQARTQVGERDSLGSKIPVFVCALCGEALN